eukprot:gnl/Dysnectes_brevis/7223_a11916_292.p1 GENE.gnl/Dysnectes_brevis/7223_a11916_292~~gnl/Dysnectes_brevis/7223_a11916_292.p1  ORF type:complete len:253 (+),score=51.53 gnl/Dysnectes_brevis/7223_a11916_292:210-968(+)
MSLPIECGSSPDSTKLDSAIDRTPSDMDDVLMSDSSDLGTETTKVDLPSSPVASPVRDEKSEVSAAVLREEHISTYHSEGEGPESSYIEQSSVPESSEDDMVKSSPRRSGLFRSSRRVLADWFDIRSQIKGSTATLVRHLPEESSGVQVAVGSLSNPKLKQHSIFQAARSNAEPAEVPYGIPSAAPSQQSLEQPPPALQKPSQASPFHYRVLLVFIIAKVAFFVTWPMTSETSKNMTMGISSIIVAFEATIY